jgi:hypothetical protein
MLSLVLGEDQDVIEVDHDAGVQEVSENVVHHCLECGRGITEAKWHD